ncbi:MAG: hypothetical protein IT442_05545 [Phycisphaeraceae bacterium]|nr:hypothetical protein [Phycisphaeraceae bacterium]
MASWQIRFSPARIHELAARYQDDDAPVLACGRRARRSGRYTRDDFLTVCRWKSPRSLPHCARNTDAEVAEATRFALSTPVERLRIEVLCCLHGVSWPTASVLLHLAHRHAYPILDFRALWSLGLERVPSYDFPFWWQYVQTCRSLADKHHVDMRTLDQALWQYSKENQPAVVQ